MPDGLYRPHTNRLARETSAEGRGAHSQEVVDSEKTVSYNCLNIYFL